MKRKCIFNSDGFLLIPVIFILMAVSLGVMAVSNTVNACNKILNSYSVFYRERKAGLRILAQFEKDIQILKNDLADDFSGEQIKGLLEKYECYSISMRDVSNGFNKQFWKQDFLDDFETDYQPFVEYGWINENLLEKANIDEILKQNEKEDIKQIFPLVNALPMFNESFLAEEFVDILKTHFAEKDELGYLMGSKTNFWEVKLETNKSNIRAVFAAIPEQGTAKIQKYELIEKSINRK